MLNRKKDTKDSNEIKLFCGSRTVRVSQQNKLQIGISQGKGVLCGFDVYEASC